MKSSVTHIGTKEIGFTGGEPFMNPGIIEMLEECLSRGFSVLVLTNAMKPMHRFRKQLIGVKERHGDKLTIRVSLDHYTAGRHEEERGVGTFAPTRDGLIWLAKNGFKPAVAGRSMWGEDPSLERAGYARLFAEHGIAIDADNPSELVLFPEMDTSVDVPEITDGMLGHSRQIARRGDVRHLAHGREAQGGRPSAVLSCTLLPYDPAFELGGTLREASRPVPLNHPHCAKFCVLGGASCSPGPAAMREGSLRRIGNPCTCSLRCMSADLCTPSLKVGSFGCGGPAFVGLSMLGSAGVISTSGWFQKQRDLEDAQATRRSAACINYGAAHGAPSRIILSTRSSSAASKDGVLVNSHSRGKLNSTTCPG